MTSEPVKVLIGVPLRGGDVRWQLFMALLRTFTLNFEDANGRKYAFDVLPAGGGDIAHARNMILREAQKLSAEIVVMIDSDMEFVPEHLARLLAWFKHPEVQFLGGLYPRKSGGNQLVLSHGLFRENSPIEGLWEVGEICTGFVAIRMQLVYEMQQKYPSTKYVVEEPGCEGETGYELFTMGVVNASWKPGQPPYSRRLSEDHYFSLRVREMGYLVHADPAIILPHYGMENLLEKFIRKQPSPA